MSNIINVDELKKAYEEASKIKEVRDVAAAQFKLIQKLQEENASLKERLSNQAPSLLGGKVSTEEMICIEQLEMLRSKSIGRELTLEEVKKLDLLNKNLRLAREQATSVIDTIEYQSLSAEELEQIAAQE
jgi:hypothetical protein